MISSVKEWSGEVLNKLIDRKRNIAKIFAVVAILAASSFVMEYFVFSYKLNVVEKNNKGISVLEKGDIATENFFLDENGNFISQLENSTLIVSTKNRYINNLELDLTENTSDSIFVKFVDPETREGVVIENRLQKNILKNKLDFMNFLVFHVDGNPEFIKIEVEKPGTIISAIKIDNQYYFNYYRFLFIFAIGLLIGAFCIFRKSIAERPEYGFLVVAIICGTLLVLSQTKSYISWDDFIHYKNVDSLTMKSLIKKDVEDIYAKTNSVPHSYSIKEQQSIDEYFDSRIKKDNSSKGKKSKEPMIALKQFYNKLGYLPAAFVTMIGRILNLPGHIIFMSGRLANVIAYSLVVFLAIRKLKSGKMLMGVIALFPTSIFLASNYGYDFWVTSFTMLGLAYLFSEIQQPEKKMSKKDAIIMLGSFVVGLGPKAIYFPLMFLVFFLKPSKFKSAIAYKRFVLASSFSIFFVLGSFLLPFLISGEGGGDSRGGSEVNSAEQVKFILTEPVAYSKILYNFMSGYISPLNAGGFMTSFAYLGSVQGFATLLFILIFVAITDKNKFDVKTSTWKLKLSVLGIYFAIVSLICTALYVAFTAVGRETIAGVQPRYLTPLIFPLLYVFANGKIKNPIDRYYYNSAIFLMIAAIFFYGVWDVIIKFYY